MLLTSLGFTLSSAPFPLPGAADVWKFRTPRLTPDPEVDRIAALLPPDAALSVQSNVGSSFAARSVIAPFPQGVSWSSHVILFLENPCEPHATFDPALRSPLGDEPENFPRATREMLRDPAFGIRYWNPPWLLLERGAAAGDQRPQILKALGALEESLRPASTER
jgi:hypothetical protein